MATSNGNYINHTTTSLSSAVTNHTTTTTTITTNNSNDSNHSCSNNNNTPATSTEADDSEAATMQMLMANLPSTAFSTSAPNPRLQKACLEMARTNQITPVLKEELRLRILSKRLEKGEPDIVTNVTEPKTYELTDEEKMKREKRKAQNRQAAKRCREKRKRKQLNEAEASEQIREENQKLAEQVGLLKKKYDFLKRLYHEHISDGHCRIPHATDAHSLSRPSACPEERKQQRDLSWEYPQQTLPPGYQCAPCKRPRSSSAAAVTGETRFLPAQRLQPPSKSASVPAMMFATPPTPSSPPSSSSMLPERFASPQETQGDRKSALFAAGAGAVNDHFRCSVTCPPQNDWATAKPDNGQAAEKLNSQYESDGTVTIALPHSLLGSDEALKSTPQGLSTLSSADVSAILPDDIDLNLSDPSSDTSSPIQNPFALLSTLSDHSASTSSFSSLPFHNAGRSSPGCSSFPSSDISSGLGQSLSFSSSNQSGNPLNASYSTDNLSFDHAPSSSFSSLPGSGMSPLLNNGNLSSANLSSFGFPNGDILPNTNLTSPYSDENFFSEEIPSSPLSAVNQLGDSELHIKNEEDEFAAYDNASHGMNPQLNLENLLPFLPNNDGSGGRSENLAQALLQRDNLAGNPTSPVTAQSSPTTLSPASLINADTPQAEQQPSRHLASNLSLDTHRSPPVPAAAYDHLILRNASACPATPFTGGPVYTQLHSGAPPDTRINKFLPMNPSSTTCAIYVRNNVHTKPRATLKRVSPGVSSSFAPAVSAQHGYATQLSSSSSSSASSTTLSPPPSVPSPSPSSSHEVPESPNILLSTPGCCEEGRGFGHHLSPISVAVSTQPSPALVEDISSDED